MAAASTQRSRPRGLKLIVEKDENTIYAGDKASHLLLPVIPPK